MAVGWVVGMLFPSVSWVCLEPRNPPPSAEQRGQGGQREATTGQGTRRSTCRRVDHRRVELPQQALVGRLPQIFVPLVSCAVLEGENVQHRGGLLSSGDRSALSSVFPKRACATQSIAVRECDSQIQLVAH